MTYTEPYASMLSMHNLFCMYIQCMIYVYTYSVHICINIYPACVHV